MKIQELQFLTRAAQQPGKMLLLSLGAEVLIGLGAVNNHVFAQGRPTPPTRDPHTAGYVEAKELPDGAVPGPTADGNFIIGPTHNAAPEMTAQQGVPQG